jgi:hypothetical protein
MSVLLMRTVTRKSIIGFGDYKDLSFGNLIDMQKYSEVLGIYYHFRNIDFCQELKDELFITKAREVDKKDKENYRYLPHYGTFIYAAIKDIFEHSQTKSQDNKMFLGIRSSEDKFIRNKKSILEFKNLSRKRLQLKNQGKYRP